MAGHGVGWGYRAGHGVGWGYRAGQDKLDALQELVRVVFSHEETVIFPLRERAWW